MTAGVKSLVVTENDDGGRFMEFLWGGWGTERLVDEFLLLIGTHDNDGACKLDLAGGGC